MYPVLIIIIIVKKKKNVRLNAILKEKNNLFLENVKSEDTGMSYH